MSCKKSEGRHHHHAAINDILYHALSSAKIPSRLEPSGLLRSDGKRPDGVTMVPWKQGKPLVWDATCPDTLAPSYRDMASIRTGAVAAAAEERKVAKYMALGRSHSFTPVAIETLGAIGPKSLAFIRDLGYRMNKNWRGKSINISAAAIVCGHPKRELGFSDGIDWKLTYPLVCLFIYYVFIY